MTVGYLLRYWPTLSETFVAREIAGLQRRGVGVTVAALGARADGALQDLAPEVRVWRPPRAWALAIPALRAFSRVEGRRAFSWLTRRLRPRDALRALSVADLAAAEGWDRVHAHFAGEAAEWAAGVAEVVSIPFSVTVHAVDLFRPRPSLPEVLRRASPVITICRHHQRWIGERYGVEARVVRSGVEPDAFPAADPGGAGARLVCVARDVPKKGLDELVAAVRDTPGVSLRLVSDAWRLGGPRVLAGPLPPSAVPGALARSHALVLPCRVAPDGDQDGLPVVLLEAMAAGLPVVTTRVAGIPELVDDEVGWLLPPDDPVALRLALREVARDPAERARRGAAGKARLIDRGWTLRRQVEELLDAWSAPSCGNMTTATGPGTS